MEIRVEMDGRCITSVWLMLRPGTCTHVGLHVRAFRHLDIRQITSLESLEIINNYILKSL